jgi:DNA-damage-inducible protein D
MHNNILAVSNSPFDSIRQIDDHGNEFWIARELMGLMGYRQWRNFETPINQAIENLELNDDKVSDHFLPLVTKSQGRDGKDFKLTRYASYMTALCCDGRKPEVAAAKKYFALKTRQAETNTAIALPQTYIEALEALVKSEKNRIMMEAEKAILEEQNHQLAEAVDDLFNYSSIIRIAKFNGVSETNFKWAVLKGMSKRMNLEVKKVPSPRFEYQLLYAHDVWRYCYPEMKLPETSTLVIQR